MALRQVCRDLWELDHDQTLGPGVQMPTRMTVIRLSDGGLWLHAPVPVDDETAVELEALGPVQHLVAPNLFHHLYLPAVAARFPEAEIHGVPRLPEKRRDIAFSTVLGVAAPASWCGDVQPLPIGGAPRLNEVVFCHRPSASLLVTDLLFNLRRPRGVMAAAFTRLTGVHGRVAQSRFLRIALVRDRVAAAASCHRLLRWSFDRLIPCHGEIVDEGAKPEVERALKSMLGGFALPPDAPAGARAPVPEV